jgi:phosphoribosyl-AMP cyclohydrolase
VQRQAPVCSCSHGIGSGKGTRLDLMSEQPAPVPSPATTGAAPGTTQPAAAAAPPAGPLPAELAAALKRDAAGLVAAVVQQFDTNEVLMLGWMDDEALHRTLTSGRVTFYSRSRQEYWRKGDTSGHVQWVKSVAMDCDGDALLVRVDQVGAACHTGTRTCFDGRGLDVSSAQPG